ncbi:site-specific integrase [Desulfotomaculum copahuensis]|uniref:Integrase n=1 Tax=Desulfotomaculum copahuensis TaxID=1838280 RepID=A0A1B7LF38_9FIRM|nr:site-specific integrase [Desulfotomaculum copahuensis]OAT82238.1 integrase [Desulfotomaculum copahuensis]
MAGWVEKRGENKWRLNVPGGTGPDGHRKTFRKGVEAPSKREAEKLLDLFSAEVLKGQYVEPSKLTFKQFAERWLRDYAEPELAPKTVHRYRELLVSRIFPAMGHLKTEDIKPIHLIEFYRNLAEDGLRLDGKMGKLSGSTIHHHHRLLSSILNDAVEWGVIPHSPAARVKPPKVKRRQADCYDREQTAAMLAALDDEPLKYKAAVVLTVASGIREGELMGLTWRDVDFGNGTIEVLRASQSLPGMGTFTKGTKNETSERLIALPASVMELLKQHKAHQAEERLRAGDLWQGTDRVFATWDGRPMYTYTVGKWFSKFLVRHNLPHIKFHALRHTSASLLLAKGIPLKSVSARLGHATTGTTADIYAHALQSVDRQAADTMDEILTAGKKRKGQA